MQLRIDRLDRDLVVAGGQAGGEYAGIATLLATHLGGHGLEVRAVATAGSFENVRMVNRGEADIGLVQSDIAAAAAKGSGAFAADGAMSELRALASLFPEAVQIVTAEDSPIATIADLKRQAGGDRPAGLGHATQCRGGARGQRRGAGRSGRGQGSGPGRGPAACWRRARSTR